MLLPADQRSKQNHKDVILPAHPHELLEKELGTAPQQSCMTKKKGKDASRAGAVDAARRAGETVETKPETACLLPRKRTLRSTPFLSSLIPLSLVVETTVRGVEHDIRVTQLLDVPSSEQQLVDCVTVVSGCNDELTNNGFAFQQEECHAHRDKLQLHCNTGH